jgi:methylase of polypeptide subunit release factors
LLAGHRPPDLRELERYVLLGCGNGETAAIVAANHPNTEVWVWDRHPGSLEATRRLGAEAGLDNLRVHEHRDLPLDLGGGPADLIVVQDVASAADDALASPTRRWPAGWRSHRCRR